MTLNTFIELTDISFDGKEHHVTFQMKGTDKRGGVYVKNAISKYDAKERAFLYLKQLFNE